jgi:hypothetical protein
MEERTNRSCVTVKRQLHNSIAPAFLPDFWYGPAHHQSRHSISLSLSLSFLRMHWKTMIPGWGHGEKRLSLLVGLVLDVISQCGIHRYFLTKSWISSSFHNSNIFIIIMCLTWGHDLSYEYSNASLFQQYNWSGHSILSTIFNPSANWLILNACSASSHHAYKFGVHHSWHIWSFITIQLYLRKYEQLI